MKKTIILLLCSLSTFLMYGQNGLSEEGQKHYLQALQYMKDASLMTDVELQTSKYKEAIREFEETLKTDSNNPEIYYNLTVVYKNIGQSTNSIEYMRNAYDNILKFKELNPEATDLFVEMELEIDQILNNICDYKMSIPSNNPIIGPGKRAPLNFDRSWGALDFRGKEHIKDDFLNEVKKIHTAEMVIYGFTIASSGVFGYTLGYMLAGGDASDTMVTTSIVSGSVVAIGLLLSEVILIPPKYEKVIGKYNNILRENSNKQWEELKNKSPKFEIGIIDNGELGIGLYF